MGDRRLRLVRVRVASVECLVLPSITVTAQVKREGAMGQCQAYEL
jgi:hypothetical protein